MFFCIFRNLVKFVENPDMETWKGYLIVFFLFFLAITQTICHRCGYHETAKLSIRIRAAIIDAIYRKILLTKNDENLTKKIGEFVNILAVDLERLELLLQYFWVLWFAPLNIICSSLILFSHIEWTSLASAFGLLIMLVANFILVKILRRFQVELLIIDALKVS